MIAERLTRSLEQLVDDGVACARRRNRGGFGEGKLATSCAFPIEPHSTWSNLAYPIAATVLLARDGSGPALVLIVASWALGVGSALYHGFKTPKANNLDRFGMYLQYVALAVAGMAVGHPALPYVMAGAALVVAVLFVYVLPAINLDVQMGVLLLFAAIPAVLNGSPLLAGISFALYLIAYGAWNLDTRTPIDRFRWWHRWGHAIWHDLTAIAAPLMFLAQRDALPFPF